MTSRNLTDVFLIMRNNALQKRKLDQNTHQNSNNEKSHKSYIPPSWVHELEQAQFELKKLKDKLAEIKHLQLENIRRPSLDDSSAIEVNIQKLAKEITNYLNSIHKIIQFIKNDQVSVSYRESRLKENIIRTLATLLQQYTTQFKSIQSQYLNELKSRENRLDSYFLNYNNLNS